MIAHNFHELPQIHKQRRKMPAPSPPPRPPPPIPPRPKQRQSEGITPEVQEVQRNNPTLTSDTARNIVREVNTRPVMELFYIRMITVSITLIHL